VSTRFISPENFIKKKPEEKKEKKTQIYEVTKSHIFVLPWKKRSQKILSYSFSKYRSTNLDTHHHAELSIEEE
jgi:hypothetical protein